MGKIRREQICSMVIGLVIGSLVGAGTWYAWSNKLREPMCSDKQLNSINVHLKRLVQEQALLNEMVKRLSEKFDESSLARPRSLKEELQRNEELKERLEKKMRELENLGSSPCTGEKQ